MFRQNLINVTLMLFFCCVGRELLFAGYPMLAGLLIVAFLLTIANNTVLSKELRRMLVDAAKRELEEERQ